LTANQVALSKTRLTRLWDVKIQYLPLSSHIEAILFDVSNRNIHAAKSFEGTSAGGLSWLLRHLWPFGVFQGMLLSLTAEHAEYTDK
jgi:hypothetical protein